MDVKKLVKMMSMIGSLNHNSYKILNLVIKSIQDGSGIVKSAKFYDSWKKDEPNMLDPEVWQTYEKCRDFTFSLESDDKLKCDIVIYEGDMLNGNRRVPRLFSTVLLPITFIFNMGEEINRQLDILLDLEYNYFLERQRMLWKEKQKKKWLNEK